MTFISNAAHQKFVQQCQSLLENPNCDGIPGADEELKRILLRDLFSLQTLAEDYMNTMAKLPELSKDYYDLQRHIRIRLRKIQQAELSRCTRK